MAPASPEQIASKLDLSISLSLHLWPALSLAVSNNWGGPSSSDKRDWLAGVLSDLFLSDPETDAVDVEEVLLQVMQDEFDVVVDDGSAGDTAERILELRADCLKGEFGAVQALYERWEKSKGKAVVGFTAGKEEDQETDGESEDGDDGEEWEGMDVDMQDAPAPVQPREKEMPVIDEDGFTKVVGKKRR